MLCSRAEDTPVQLSAEILETLATGQGCTSLLYWSLRQAEHDYLKGTRSNG